MSSCGGGDEDEPGGLTPTTITAKDGTVVQVRKAGPVTFVYDNYDQFDGFMHNGQSYHIDENNTLKFSYYDLFIDEDARHIINQFTMKINDRGLVSTIDFKLQFVYDEEGVEYRINGKMVYGYDKDKRVTGMTTKYILQEIRKQITKRASLEIYQTTTWKNGMLTAFNTTEISKWQSSESKDGMTNDLAWDEEKTTKAVVNYGSEKNDPKQMPATLCDVMFNDLCIPMFAPLGMYGVGPTYLPKNCTLYIQEIPQNGTVESSEDEVTFNFTTNSDGTIASEWMNDDEPTNYQYTVTRAITDEQAEYIISGLKRLAKIED